jgi:branched-subunit amino acid ABC-type transport system permease component/ABC-type branched-subunit amino acid transport system ATPase component
LDKFVALVISGAVSGAIYSLIAAGLVLSYSTSGVFNFAHGAVAFATAFVFYELHTGLGWNTWLAAGVSVLLFAPLLGLLLDRVVFRGLTKADTSAKIVATVGLMIAIPSIVLFTAEVLIDNFGVHIPRGDNVFAPPGLGPVPKSVWSWSTAVRIDSDQAIILGLAAAAAVGLWVLVRHTRLGLFMRAAVEKPELAETRGVNTKRTSAVSWALGFFLAGLAGVAGAPLFTLTPASYTAVLFVAATAAVVGNLRSVPIAFAGGLALGLAQSLFAGYATFASKITGFATSVPFIILFVALLVLNRDRSRVAGQVAEAEVPPDHHSDLSPVRRFAPWVIAGVAFCVYLFFVADVFWRSLLTQGLAYSIIFLSFVIVTGIGGMVSLAQAAFVTFASLTTGLLLSHGLPFVLAAAIGCVLAAVVGALVALPSIRLGGLALALSTLALALIGDRVLFAWDFLRNSSNGWKIRRPSVGTLGFADDRAMAVLFMIVIAVVVLMIVNLQRSASGRKVSAVRTAAPAATSVGISLLRSKLWIFALSAAVAGLGGLLLGTFNGSVTNQSYPAGNGLVWLAIVVLFGIRRPGGAVIAGIVFAISPEVIGWFTSSTRVADILFGLGAVQLARTPDGILANFAGQAAARRARRRSRAETTSSVAPQDTPSRLPEPPRSDEPIGVTAKASAPGTELGVVADASARTVENTDGLRLARIVAGYETVEVLHGLDVVVPAGTITALLGANGAGKSTLCKVAAGVLIPTSGSVSVDGLEVTGLAGWRRHSAGVAYAPESRGVFGELTVEDNLSLTLPSAADRHKVYERFAVLGERRNLPAGNLSGGEQQMLTMAPLMVRPPKVLVADEPSLGLAPLVVAQIMALLAELRDAGTAVLVVEEKATHLLDVADQVALLELGRVVWVGPAVDLDQDRIADSYLQVSASGTSRKD